MTNKRVLKIPTTEKKVKELKAGDELYLSGLIHNMRGSLFRLAEMAERGEKIPEALKSGLKDSAVYYAGPIVDSKKERVLSAASTTSKGIPISVIERVIKDFGVRIIISKEGLAAGSIDLLKENGVAYLVTVVGAGAWYAYPRIKRIKEIFWDDLGMAEACYIMEVEKFGPVWVGIDANGNSLYEDTKQLIEENVKKIYKELGWQL